MKNIFEGAKFGDKFLTRDGRIAVFLGGYDDNKTWYKIAISGENEIRSYKKHGKSGLLRKIDGEFPNDIVEKYQGTIDEEKLEELANNEYYKSTIYKVRGYYTKEEMWVDGFMEGFEKAMRE